MGVRLRLTVLLVLAGLFTHTQCFARCLAAPSQHHQGCHHSSPSQSSETSHCATLPAADVLSAQAKIEIVKAAALALSPAWSSALESAPPSAPPFTASPLAKHRAHPPDKPLFLTASILRL